MYKPEDYHKAAEFLRQYAAEDKSGQMANIARMLDHTGQLASIMAFAGKMIDWLEADMHA